MSETFSILLESQTNPHYVKKKVAQYLPNVEIESVWADSGCYDHIFDAPVYRVTVTNLCNIVEDERNCYIKNIKKLIKLILK